MELFSTFPIVGTSGKPELAAAILSKQGNIKSLCHTDSNLSFNGLGLCNWVCQSTSSMGFRRPTDIQASCIPAILNGRSVIGCAETGVAI